VYIILLLLLCFAVVYIPDSDVLVTEWIIIILSMKDAIQALHTCRAAWV